MARSLGIVSEHLFWSLIFFFLPHTLRELKFSGQDIGREHAYNL